MIHAWRLVKSKHAASAFNGDGARIAGGRWNRQGTAVVYVSGSLALAVLELFVHLGESSRWSLDLARIPVSIPDELVVEPPTLPRSWRSEPPAAETMDLGTRWADSRSSCALRVPSAIVPEEHNFVLNPTHPGFPSIDIGDPAPYSFDPRMWK